MGRSFLAVFLGLLLAMVVAFVLEIVGHLVYPPPPGLDLADPAALRSFTESIPAGAFVLLLVGWLVGAAAGGWLAARLAPRAPIVHALIVGAIILMGAVSTMVMIPHPVWVWCVALIELPSAAYVGARLAGRPKALDRTIAAATQGS